MKHAFHELPGWIFDIDEVSANVYVVVGLDGAGHRIDLRGTDPDKLLDEAKRAAMEIREGAP